MAFAVQVIGVPRRPGEPGWVLDVVAWPARTLIEDARFRPVDLDGTFYRDHVALLTTKEAAEMNRAHRDEDLSAHLDSHAGGLVVVKVYEWESGLD
jgi:hypothetical protein